MKETGLMFKAPLVRAILSGQKTQTRRICKPAVAHNLSQVVEVPDPQERGQVYNGSTFGDEEGDILFSSPFGGLGDRIYVRETWAYGVHALAASRDEDGPFVYAAEGTTQGRLCERWRPSIHMPKHAARIWLEITGVRVERLQAISEDDAEAEGCERLETERDERDYKLCPKCGGTRLHNAIGGNGGVIFDVDCQACDTYAKRFRHLWDSTGGDWAANPWVWVIDFKRIDQPAPKEAP
ncbi:hypothetical protein WH367_16645 [Comamonas sp. MYb21]|uniref:hypothetical protein n=1 Tax=Comamonas sp. MYb21 TaxID=1848648 RepID=UPI0030AB7812